MNKQIVLIMGAPFSGKGYLCEEMLEIGLNFVHLSMGEIIRHEIKSGNQIANLVYKIVKSGKFLPDELVNTLAFNRISVLAERPLMFLDGFPRTFGQCTILNAECFKKSEIKIVFVDTPLCICKQRAFQGELDEDYRQALCQKFNDFESQTLPLIRKMIETYPFVRIDGRETDHSLVKIVETLGLQSFIDLDQVSPEVIEHMELWRFGLAQVAEEKQQA